MARIGLEVEIDIQIFFKFLLGISPSAAKYINEKTNGWHYLEILQFLNL